MSYIRTFQRWIKPYHSGIAVTSQTATAGRVLMVLFEVLEDVSLDGIACQNAATVAGNATVGVYGPITTEETSSSVPLLVESASTALSGVNSSQFISFTATRARKGRYYAVIEFSDATHTYQRQSNTTQVVGFGALYDRSGGYGALTNPSPSTTNTGNALPGLYVRCVV